MLANRPVNSDSAHRTYFGPGQTPQGAKSSPQRICCLVGAIASSYVLTFGLILLRSFGF